MICHRDPEILWHYLTRAPGKLWSLARMYTLDAQRARRAHRGPSAAAPLPHLITLQVDNRCNLRCVQCWEWGRQGAYKNLEPSEVKEELTTEEWLRFLAAVSRRRPYIYFFGGEPFLRSDILTLLAAAARRCPTAINSNTTLITPAMAEGVVRAGLDYFIASLDGPEAVNNRIRIGHDVFNRVTRGIGELIAARRRLASPLPIVELCTTVTEENHRHLLETAEIADGLGVDVFSLQFGSFTTRPQWETTRERLQERFGVEPLLMRGFLRDSYGVDTEAIERQLREIRRRSWRFHFKSYPGSRVRTFSVTDHFSAPHRVHEEMDCMALWRRMYVRPNGDIGPCTNYPEVRLGNIVHDELPSAWNGGTMQAFRRMIKEEGLLPSCSRCCELYELGVPRLPSPPES